MYTMDHLKKLGTLGQNAPEAIVAFQSDRDPESLLDEPYWY